MHPELDIEEALQRDDLVFIDVRTPSEFGRASIPGAVNIPLFDDRQFRELGAIYRNRGEKAARLAGLALAAPKLPELVEQIRTASGAKTPLIYCWRGGLRSLSLYQILNLAGVPALRLRGGYRAFRRYVNARLRDFSLQSEILVLHGLTGVGKTALIRALARKGYAALDLEGLARHRGSVFGAVGIQPRSQRDFEALLLQKLQRFKDSPYLVLEGEGKRIGNIHLPPFLTRAMEEGKHLLLTAPLPVRVERILEDYLAIPPPRRWWRRSGRRFYPCAAAWAPARWSFCAACWRRKSITRWRKSSVPTITTAFTTTPAPRAAPSSRWWTAPTWTWPWRKWPVSSRNATPPIPWPMERSVPNNEPL